jgi:hypothetical protein
VVAAAVPVDTAIVPDGRPNGASIVLVFAKNDHPDRPPIQRPLLKASDLHVCPPGRTRTCNLRIRGRPTAVRAVLQGAVQAGQVGWIVQAVRPCHGQTLATVTVAATPAGYQQLLHWAARQPGQRLGSGKHWRLRRRPDQVPACSHRAGGGTGPAQARRPPSRRQVRPAGCDQGRPPPSGAAAGQQAHEGAYLQLAERSRRLTACREGTGVSWMAPADRVSEVVTRTLL